ncbi:methyltransferase-like protein 6 [Paraphysoderma sedebokerense]|nr:methyltransferase-like protein 6 [Paraphysoderma sedebokerense]
MTTSNTALPASSATSTSDSAAITGTADQCPPPPSTTLHPSIISKAHQILSSKDDPPISEFWQNKYKREAQRNWDVFYKLHTTNFFKDRHWTDKEFEELRGEDGAGTGEGRTLLEVGCGVGNFVFPLIEQYPNLRVIACDFSKRAIDFVKSNPKFTPERCTAFVCDLTTNDLLDNVEENSVDIVSMIFVLSAIPPEKMEWALENVWKVLKPGGMILFRDYGLYDEAQLRFKTGHKLEENLYVRQDGTLAFYFNTELVKSLATTTGFEILENNYIYKEIVNRKTQVKMERVFLQGRFRKPQK